MSDLFGLIIAGIVGGIIGFIVGFFSNYLSGRAIVNYQRKLEKIDKEKEAKEVGKEYLKIKLAHHKIDVMERGLKNFEHTEIRCDKFDLWKSGDFNFKVEIKGFRDLEKLTIYKQAIQHLEAYPDTYRLWDGSIKKIYGDNGLNDVLKRLKKYLTDKISNKFDVEQDEIHKSIWCVIEGTKSSVKIKNSKDFYGFLDEINITIKGKSIYVDSSDGKNLGQMHCKRVDVNNVKEFLSDLIKKDTNFRERIKSFMMGYKELKETFEIDFKNKLNELLQEVGDDKENLIGECDKCKLWLKEIG